MNGTSRERGLRGAGGTAVQDRGSCHRTSPPSNPTPVPAMIQWLLRVLAQTWKSCVPGPPGATCRHRRRPSALALALPRSHHPSSLQRPVYRHHPPNICCIQGLAFVVLKMAWELTRQRWIRTINSKFIYGLVVGFHPLSRALPVMWMAWMMQVDKQEPPHVHHPAPIIHLAARVSNKKTDMFVPRAATVEPHHFCHRDGTLRTPDEPL